MTHISYDDLRADTVRQVAKLMAAAAITAPKSGGQMFLDGRPNFIETVVVDDRDTMPLWSTWMRARGKERREAIWFRAAAGIPGDDEGGSVVDGESEPWTRHAWHDPGVTLIASRERAQPV